MELAIQIADTYETVLATTQWAEDRGIAAVSLPDHYLYGKPPFASPAPEALTQIAGLARETTKIELSTLVSPVTFRHPAVFAKTAITLDRMSGGRFTLGLGTGWMDEEHEIFGFHYPPMGERFEMLEETLAYVRSAFDPGEVSYTGERHRLQPVEIQPAATHRPKLVVGGDGPHKTPRLAGTYADEFNVYARPHQEMIDRIAKARAAAEEAGRDPSALMISTACPPLIEATENDYQLALDEGSEAFGIPRDEIEGRFVARDFPLGTPDRFAATIGAWKELGVTRFYMQRITSGRSLEEAGSTHRPDRRGCCMTRLGHTAARRRLVISCRIRPTIYRSASRDPNPSDLAQTE